MRTSASRVCSQQLRVFLKHLARVLTSLVHSTFRCIPPPLYLATFSPSTSFTTHLCILAPVTVSTCPFPSFLHFHGFYSRFLLSQASYSFSSPASRSSVPLRTVALLYLSSGHSSTSFFSSPPPLLCRIACSLVNPLPLPLPAGYNRVFQRGPFVSVRNRGCELAL